MRVISKVVLVALTLVGGLACVESPEPRRPGLTGAGGTDVGGPGGAGGTAGGKIDGGSLDAGRPDLKVGQTEFTTDEPGSAGGSGGSRAGADAGSSAGTGGSGGSGGGGGAAAQPPGAPMGRSGTVEEGDIYRMDGTHLYYFNTYRGFITYDVGDPRNPKQLGRLPVYGYPVEMFVDGKVVYALLRDALYLSQKSGRLEFERHNVSQLVTIDVSDPANPKVLKTVDIIGQLREGVSRKIDKTIYVVPYIPQNYYWGWYYTGPPMEKEQAWVYSFDVSTPSDPKLVQKLKLFEGGSIRVQDPQSRAYFNRSFTGVSIAATSNALMVVENWSVYGYDGGGGGGCGSWNNDQTAVVSIVDISDPAGAIRLHTRFETGGELRDQFKQTYAFDPQTKTGTYWGIFARRAWQSDGCRGSSVIRNTLESWDITDGSKPARLAQLDFGKPDEIVRGSAYDLSRQVVYAITARQIDPLYAISLADRKNPKILSAIDGLSGDMSVFRLAGGGKFLLAVGTDISNACTGFMGDPNQWATTKVALSIIDVRDLAKVRLVQRQCVAIKNAGWTTSGVNSNLDQAHKMLGMHADGDLNVVTVPVNYWNDVRSTDWSWSRYETAVGLMTWDLTRYDDTKNERQQTVIQNYGTFVHPHGEVRRSIVMRHPTTKRRVMFNLSETHVTVADLEDLANPMETAKIEVAPYVSAVYRFGDFLVEQVELNGRPNYHWYGSRPGATEFRVKRAGGPIDDKVPLQTFTVGQVTRTVKHGQKLLIFRTRSNTGNPYSQELDVVVYDLSAPERPRYAGVASLPVSIPPFYRYYCGMGFGGSYWFDGGGLETSTATDDALLMTQYDYSGGNARQRLTIIDLRNPDGPVISGLPLTGSDDTYNAYGLVPDPIASNGFFITYRTSLGVVNQNGRTYNRYKHWAQRWQRDGSTWKGGTPINMPGRLVRTFTTSAGGPRLYVTQDIEHRYDPSYTSTTRLNLLQEYVDNGKPLASLLDARRFDNMYVSGLVISGNRLLITARPNGGYYRGGSQPRAWEETSDRLLIFTITGDQLVDAYNAPLRAWNTQLVGALGDRLFLSLQSDGVLAVDISNPVTPTGTKFLRTLGYTTHLDFSADDLYIAAGNFGVFHAKLSGAAELPLD